MEPISLKYRYDLRERINLYGGMALGVLIPIAVIRYMEFGNFDGDYITEGLRWAGATAMSIPFLPFTFAGGTVGGVIAAGNLSDKRRQKGIKKYQRESQLNELINGEK